MPPSSQQSLWRPRNSPKEIFREIRNYLAGQFIGATRDDILLEEVLKCLFCKLLIERSEVPPIKEGVEPFQLANQVRSIFTKVRDDFPDIYDPGTEILLDPRSLTYVMTSIEFSVMDSDTDPIGDAFEIFIGSESKGNAGQFLSPRGATSLIVSAIDPQPHETLLDPAVGAGGFFTATCAHFVRQGLSPADLATIASRNFFGVDKDATLAKLARIHIALLTGGHPHIFCGDSLAFTNEKGEKLNHIPKEGVDVIFTNPPFGVRIVAANPTVLRSFELARKWVLNKTTDTFDPTKVMRNNVSPQVLFLERCLTLLKSGGRLGMVVPESLLSNKSYRYVVEYLSDHADIRAVLGMPDALFKTSGKGGTHTKTCLLIATKRTGLKKDDTPEIFMAEAKWCGQDSRARAIPHNDLPIISQNYRNYLAGHQQAPSPLGFVIPKHKVSSGVLCPRYYDPQPDKELEVLRDTHDLLVLGDLVDNGVLQLSTGNEIGKLAYGTGSIPFIRTSDISNWEVKADPKHGVSREIYESLRVKQDVRAGDLLFVRDGTYLIGTCAIVSEEDREMLYQSHIFKIRVVENSIDLNPYLLLAVLSSVVVQKQVRSKQFTQDIIDSLGDRIRELILPIPKQKRDRNRITELVRSSVQHRLEARHLSLQARKAVVEPRG